MGQAKNRGTKEQRIAEAREKQMKSLDISQKPMEEIYQEFDLPEDSDFLGYVINIVESDEYLASFSDSVDERRISYAKSPELGLRFEDFHEALDVGKKVAEKYETDICLLFETTDQYRVIPSFTVNLANFRQ